MKRWCCLALGLLACGPSPSEDLGSAEPPVTDTEGVDTSTTPTTDTDPVDSGLPPLTTDEMVTSGTITCADPLARATGPLELLTPGGDFIAQPYDPAATTLFGRLRFWKLGYCQKQSERDIQELARGTLHSQFWMRKQVRSN